MTKIRSNIESILESIQKTIGTKSNPIHSGANVYGKFIQYTAFTHAVEEYGKLLYVHSLTPDVNNEYRIEYDKKETSNGLFKDHAHKFDLAQNDLGAITKVHEGAFSSAFSKTSFDTDTDADWDSRVNILNTDIDANGNPTNIYSSIDLDMLRQSTDDFLSKIRGFQILK